MIPSDTIAVVCGFSRCGASLVLQMLHAGGASVSGTYPSFEEPAFDPSLDDRAAFIGRNLGRAIKSFERRNGAPLPPGAKYRYIWLDRDPDQQARSTLKVAKALGSFVGNERSARKALAISFRRDKPRAIAKLRAIGADVLQWQFEDLLDRPLASAQAFAEHLHAPLDIGRMERVPRERTSDCLPYILEVELLAAAECGP